MSNENLLPSNMALPRATLKSIANIQHTEMYDAANGIDTIAELIFNSLLNAEDGESDKYQIAGLSCALRTISRWIYLEADQTNRAACTAIGEIDKCLDQMKEQTDAAKGASIEEGR